MWRIRLGYVGDRIEIRGALGWNDCWAGGDTWSIMLGCLMGWLGYPVSWIEIPGGLCWDSWWAGWRYMGCWAGMPR